MYTQTDFPTSTSISAYGQGTLSPNSPLSSGHDACQSSLRSNVNWPRRLGYRGPWPAENSDLWRFSLQSQEQSVVGNEGIPAFNTSRAASVSAFFSTRSASLNISFARSAAGTFNPQDVLKARWAASTAVSTSSFPATVALVMTEPSADNTYGQSDDRSAIKPAYQGCKGYGKAHISERCQREALAKPPTRCVLV